VPQSEKPLNGWPVIIVNHGYITPQEYSTSDDYHYYTNEFSKNGYVVFKPDYRGNGKSEGTPKQSYISADYVTDDLNAIASIKKTKDPATISFNPSQNVGLETRDTSSGAVLSSQDRNTPDTKNEDEGGSFVNTDKIGVWGHSMGGNITLQDLVLSHDIKAAVIWSGVVGSYADLEKWWDKKVASGNLTSSDKNTQAIIDKVFSVVGTPESNPDFWNSVDPTNYVKDIVTPVQLHAGLDDHAVPWEFSENLKKKLEKVGKKAELYTYSGEDHNLVGPDFHLAMQRSLDYFDKYLRNN
jgi:dipeptidyl aminopeptidase/acylaminoacyl peptidase